MLGLGLLAWTVKVGGNVVCGAALPVVTSHGDSSSGGEPGWEAASTQLIARCESAARPYVWSGACMAVLGTVLLVGCLYMQLRPQRKRTLAGMA